MSRDGLSPSGPRFSEPDLPERARNQFERARTTCGTCRGYHSIYPYLRLSGVAGGVEADAPCLEPLLADMLDARPLRLLIAGSADTGITALVHRAAGDGIRRHQVLVVDRCETPLAGCRAYARSHGFDLRSVCCDLRELDRDQDITADLVLGHSILPFMDADGRARVLSNLHDALAPGGRMVLATRLTAPGQQKAEAGRWTRESVQATRARIRDALAVQGLPLPGDEAEFDALVEDYAAHSNQSSAFGSTAELEAELNEAGFEVSRWIEAGRGLAYLDDGTVRTGARPGWVAVTEPR